MKLINAGVILYSNGIVFGRTLVDKETIDRMPAIDPESLRPQGELEEYPDSAHLRCTVCKYEFLKSRLPTHVNYCHICGARMKGAGENETD